MAEKFKTYKSMAEDFKQDNRLKLLESQRDKAQTRMDGLAKQVNFGKITSAEAKRRRILYKRIISRSNSVLKPKAIPEKWKGTKESKKKVNILQALKNLSPGSSTRKLEEVRKKAGGK